MLLNKSELKSNFWELFEWSSVIRKQPIKLYLKKKFYQVSIKEFIEYMAALHKQLPEAFCKKGVLRNFVKFTGKHLSQSLFFNHVAGLGLQHYQKMRDSGTSVFLWILQNVVDTFSTEHLGTTAFVPIWNLSAFFFEESLTVDYYSGEDTLSKSSHDVTIPYF